MGEDLTPNALGQIVLRNPTNREIADCLGFNEAIDRTQVRDVVIVGPDRLDWLRRFMPRQRDWTCSFWNPKRLVDRPAQVGVEKYLGFPTRISGTTSLMPIDRRSDAQTAFIDCSETVHQSPGPPQTAMRISNRCGMFGTNGNRSIIFKTRIISQCATLTASAI